jgi:hypothetical protein
MKTQRLRGPAGLLVSAAMLFAVLTAVPLSAARADTLTFDLTQCFITGGCPTAGPYGTVTVSSVSSTEVSVDLQLTAGEVYNIAGGNGAGKPLLFDITGDPVVTVTNLTSPFTFTRHLMTMADGTGQWDYFIGCSTSSCGSGTSGLVSADISFDVTLASGITPASFVQNANGFYFASDIGIPSGGGNYVTGDVAAPPGAAVPLPAAAWLLLSGLAGVAVFARMNHWRPAQQYA